MRFCESTESRGDSAGACKGLQPASKIGSAVVGGQSCASSRLEVASKRGKYLKLHQNTALYLQQNTVFVNRSSSQFK